MLRAGTFAVDPARHAATKAGAEVRPAPIEHGLPRVLAVDAVETLTHHRLPERVWGGHASENGRRRRVYVNDLRRKLEEDPARPCLVPTEPGVGYRLSPYDDQPEPSRP